jgi:hypothetical protein
MKTKHLLLGLAILVTAGSLWCVRLAWRAHCQLVTLDVRETPLKEVIRKLEWQTWTKIRADHSLEDVRVTLRIVNQPLPNVLHRLAVQAGARCATLYAIYGSTRGLKALDAALSGDGQLEAAGWTRLNPPKMFTLALPGGGQTTVPVMPPKELLMETSLRAGLGTNEALPPTEAGAAAIAHKVIGRWTTYFEFTKPAAGVGVGLAGFSRTNSARVSDAQSPNARFANLTPQQRVQQARRDRGLPGK